MLTALVDLSVLETHTNTRGIGRYVFDLSRGLSAIARQQGGVRLLGVERLSYLGAPVVTEDIEASARRLVSAENRLRHPAWAYRVRLRLAAASERVPADVLHSGHPNATPLGRVQCPRVGTCHDLIALLYPQHHTDWRDGFATGRRWLDRRRFFGMSHVIAISRATADDLMRLLGLPADRITVVYNGVDVSLFCHEVASDDEAVLTRFGLAEPFVLCVGAANWRKNSEGMIAGFARAQRRVKNLELVWVGRLGKQDAERVAGAARREGVEANVHLVGYVEDADLAALYRRAVAQLFVSRAEGFGYPVVEAMAAGCPVVTSNQSSLREVAGSAAILVDPEDVASIGDAVADLAESEGRRSELAGLGIERARQFTLGKMATETLEVYREVARRS